MQARRREPPRELNGDVTAGFHESYQLFPNGVFATPIPSAAFPSEAEVGMDSFTIGVYVTVGIAIASIVAGIWVFLRK